MVAMNVNSNTYACDISTSAQTITLVGNDVNCTSFIVDNPSTTAGLFVTSGVTTATAAFPAAGSKAAGKYIGPGKSQVYTKNPEHDVLSIIASANDTSVDAYVAIGAGE